MAGVTPLYGIRYPNGTTKAKDLGLELGTMGSDIEQALQTAGVSPVIEGQIITAPSAAARDGYFGVPATESERLALQARGATCLRTDMGWTEQFFATYSTATNPQGTTLPGWYPVAGNLPTCMVSKSTAQNTGAGSYAMSLLGFDLESFDPLNMHTAANPTRITFPIGGIYRVDGAYFGDTNQVFGIEVRLNGTYVEGSRQWMPALGAGGLSAPSVSCLVRASAGQYVELGAASTVASQAVVVASGYRPRFAVNYVRPV